MKKVLLILSILFILNNCGGFEFVYKTNIKNLLIKNTTEIKVKGDDTVDVYVSLIDIFGKTDNDFPKFRLSVNSVKTESAAVISKDATATKFNIQYLISYDLYNLYKNCSIAQKEITTVSSYSVKSAGYSFGTDLSQKETSQQIIKKNINEFIFYINTLSSLDKCTGVIKE